MTLEKKKSAYVVTVVKESLCTFTIMFCEENALKIRLFYLQVNTQLYSSREKADLAQLVCIMIAYNMTYHQEKTIEGQYSYVLDPYVVLE